MESLSQAATVAERGPGLPWRNRFAALDPALYTRLAPTPLPVSCPPYWVARSMALARELGLDESWFASDLALAVFSGNAHAAGSDPLASVYSGHQFGVWAGQLGDGRAILLGELETALGGREIQLKGAGRTPYSRGADGRAVLRSSIREFLCSEAMHGLGIPTTRALCITGSDAPVQREETETAAIVTRVAPSFIRFGHFEHFAYSQRPELLRQLADHVIEHHYPACRDAAQPYAALLRAVTERSAELIARWQGVGFCHGVMNTDNMSILGLTIDYGPFQFMDGYDPGHICNHSDQQGRYAFGRQQQVAYWNLFCLGQALLPLIVETDDVLAALEPYKTRFPQALLNVMHAKLGLPETDQAGQHADRELVDGIARLLAAGRVDWTIFWRRLNDFEPAAARDAERHASANAPLRDLFADRAGFDAWAARYAARLDALTPAQRAAGLAVMGRANPRYVLRNHLAQQAIERAKQKDFSEVERLLKVLQHPFDQHPGCEDLAAFPPDWASSIEISCSS